MTKEKSKQQSGEVILFVKARTELPEEEFLRIAKEREPQFEAIPGLLQKYYIKTKNPAEFGGVYVWDSVESLREYRESELAAGIAKAYKTTGTPSMEIMDVLFALRT